MGCYGGQPPRHAEMVVPRCGQILGAAIENGWELEWFTPGVFEKYLAGGETVQVAANANIEVKVKAQP